jgi:hypothetical protein
MEVTFYDGTCLTAFPERPVFSKRGNYLVFSEFPLYTIQVVVMCAVDTYQVMLSDEWGLDT